ncbi:MAG TPA: CHAD domain-containing protein [Acidimicrobiales bacterium]
MTHGEPAPGTGTEARPVPVPGAGAAPSDDPGGSGDSGGSADSADEAAARGGPVGTGPEAGADAEALLRRVVTGSVAQLLRHDPGARQGIPEDVHKFRVATRRLRSDLGTFRSVLDRAWSRPRRDELRWLGGEVGAVRDLDVFTDRLGTRLAARSDHGGPAGETLLDRFRGRRAAALTRLQATLRGERYRALLHLLVDAGEEPRFDPPGAAATPAADLARRVVGRAWRALAEGVEDLAPDPPDHELHEVRILAKRCRYAAEAVAPVIGGEAARFAAAVEAVQTVLGDHQDTVVAEQVLAEAATHEDDGRGDGETVGSDGTAALVAELIEAERADRRRLRAEWPVVWAAAADPDLRRWFTATEPG